MTDIIAALRKCTGGEVIDLAGASIAPPVIADFAFTKPVTLANGTITGLDMRRVRGFVLDRLTLIAGPRLNNNAIGHGSADIHVTGCTVRGPDDRPIQEATCTGLSLRTVEGYSITNSDFSHAQFALSLQQANDGEVRGNRFHDNRKDALRLIGCSRVVVAENDFTDFYPVDTGGPGDHPDAIQCWNEAGMPGDDITIERNRIWRGKGGPVQGIFCRYYPASSGRPAFRRLIVRDNIVAGAIMNGIAVSGDGEVTGNVVIEFADQKSSIRWDAWEGPIRGNQAARYIVGTKDAGVPDGNDVLDAMSAVDAQKVIDGWRTPVAAPVFTPEQEARIRAIVAEYR